MNDSFIFELEDIYKNHFIEVVENQISLLQTPVEKIVYERQMVLNRIKSMYFARDLAESLVKLEIWQERIMNDFNSEENFSKKLLLLKRDSKELYNKIDAICICQLINECCEIYFCGKLAGAGMSYEQISSYFEEEDVNRISILIDQFVN